ncbi:MAG: hypothetical protein HQ594_06695 [Candidatus Omnitrophica bacterium]|nr:hypothetical protein [Candidatus Omnitrophota bacterium]
MKNRFLRELERHAPFTAFGAVTGIAIMAASYNMPQKIAFRLFYTLHPLHVLLSALVTAAMYKNYKCGDDKHGCNIFELLAVGFVGSIGIATLSDCIIPYIGEKLLHMPHAELHTGFIEMWWLILPLAAIGVGIAYFWPRTKIPHAGHVLISTWASLFHMIMAEGKPLGLLAYAAVFAFLFIAVWVPCCMSDIVFPLLFVGKGDEDELGCPLCHEE